MTKNGNGTRLLSHLRSSGRSVGAALALLTVVLGDADFAAAGPMKNDTATVSSPTARPAANSDSDLASVVEGARAEFCQPPTASTCQILDKFRQGQLPKLRGSEAMSLGVMYRDSGALPRLPKYLAVRLRAQGAELAASSILLTPENDTEQKDTESYIQSIRTAHRDPSSVMHKFVEKQLNTHSPSLKVERQKDAIFVSSPENPGGFWIRQVKNEWIVLHLVISRSEFRIVPIIRLIVMPLD